jgi:DNA polymerase I
MAVHPIFQVLGTVSGRIQVADPQLQHLRRKYRSIIAPDPGFRLTYIDYAQFEPGIISYLAGDPQLMDDYNAGDLYAGLSAAIFGSPDRRNE